MKFDKIIKKIILVMGIVLALTLLIYLMVVMLYKKDYRTELNERKLEVYEEIQEEMYMPNGIFDLKQNYEGNQDLKDFYKNIKDFYELVIEISKLKEEKIEEYYQENNYMITRITGIKSVEDFQSFASYSRQHGKLNSLVNANIETDTFKNSTKSLNFRITFNFDNEKKLTYEVSLMNYLSNIIAKYKEVQ